MEQQTEITLEQCPECQLFIMPKGNKYCSMKCWQAAMNKQREEFLE